MNIDDLRAMGFDIANPAEPYYDRMTLDRAIEYARERIDEWDYELDPHGYCHERPMLIALVLAASWAARGNVDAVAARWAAPVAAGTPRVRRADDLMWAIMAGEPVTLFGRRVQFTLGWPDGRPFDFATDEDLRRWAKRALAAFRGFG